MSSFYRFKEEIKNILQKDRLLELAESVADWKQYGDPTRTADFFEKRWSKDYIEKNNLKHIVDFFGEKEHLYRYMFLKFEPNSILPYHIDINRLCAISIPLSHDAAPIEFKDEGLVYYGNGAIIDVTKSHRVTNNNNVRYMFQLSIYDDIEKTRTRFLNFLEEEND